MFGRLFLLVYKLVCKYRQIAKYEKIRETLSRTISLQFFLKKKINLNFGAKNQNWPIRFEFCSARQLLKKIIFFVFDFVVKCRRRYFDWQQITT